MCVSYDRVMMESSGTGKVEDKTTGERSAWQQTERLSIGRVYLDKEITKN